MFDTLLLASSQKIRPRDLMSVESSQSSIESIWARPATGRRKSRFKRTRACSIKNKNAPYTPVHSLRGDFEKLVREVRIVNTG